MIESPICLSKGGIIHPLEKLGFIKRPFFFRLRDARVFPVGENERPIFFVRKRIRVSSKKGVKSHYVHRYCVGVKRADGSQEKNWIFPDGSFDITGEAPSA